MILLKGKRIQVDALSFVMHKNIYIDSTGYEHFLSGEISKTKLSYKFNCFSS